MKENQDLAILLSDDVLYALGVMLPDSELLKSAQKQTITADNATQIERHCKKSWTTLALISLFLESGKIKS